MLTMGTPDNSFVSGTIEALKKHNMPMDIFSTKEAMQRYPMVSYPDGYTFVLDPSGGILYADKALNAFQV